jgi:hypothetical protein
MTSKDQAVVKQVALLWVAQAEATPCGCASATTALHFIPPGQPWRNAARTHQ